MNIIQSTFLNTVAAASADLSSQGGGKYTVTGLLASFQKPITVNKTVAANNFTVVTATGGTTATTLTDGGAGADVSVTVGRVYAVTGNGSTYYAYAPATAGPAASVAVLWTNANPGTITSGETITYEGWGSYKMLIGSVSAGTEYALTFTGVSPETGMPFAFNWTYTVPTGGTVAAALTDLYNSVKIQLGNMGFYTVTDASTPTYVVATWPSNTSLVIQNGSNATASVTLTATSPLARVGYGADLIAEGYPTASGSASNDGIVSTNFYTLEQISSTVASEASSLHVDTFNVFINTGSGNAAALITSIDALAS